jgi:RES domain-containing protein
MTLVRLNRSRYSPKDTTGSRLHGGCWNSPGVEVLYASSTLALACLEILVHIRDIGLIPTDYVFCGLDVPEELITPWRLTGESALAKIESPVLSREHGDAWINSTKPPRSWEGFRTYVLTGMPEYVRRLETEVEPITPVLAIPSAIIPREMNYLISPVHPQFDRIIWGEPTAFRFDPRLIATAK